MATTKKKCARLGRQIRRETGLPFTVAMQLAKLCRIWETPAIGALHACWARAQELATAAGGQLELRVIETDLGPQVRVARLVGPRGAMVA